MSAADGVSSASHLDLGPGSLDSIRELIVRSTPESLEQAVVRMKEIQEQLTAGVLGRRGLRLNAVEGRELQNRLFRLRECAERGDQMVSGRLQLILGPNLLYDRQARPSQAYLPSRMQLEG